MREVKLTHPLERKIEVPISCPLRNNPIFLIRKKANFFAKPFRNIQSNPAEIAFEDPYSKSPLRERGGYKMEWPVLNTIPDRFSVVLKTKVFVVPS